MLLSRMWSSVGVLLLVLVWPGLTGGLDGPENRDDGYDYFKFHHMPEITSWMDMITAQHREVVSMVTYGATYENKAIRLLKIGLSSSQKKKAIWMDCGIHAREWISPAFCQYFVKQILDSYLTDPQVNKLMTDLDFYVTPVLNVDGYAYSWKDNTTRAWRKSRSPGPIGCECDGTDLNRNFDSYWGTIGTSSDCCSSIYSGPKVQSEPETRAVTEYVGKNADIFLAFLTIHSHKQLILVPYGNPNFNDPKYDEMMEVGLAAARAIKLVHGMNYTVGTPTDVLRSNSGSSRDWARLTGIPYVFTFELRDKGEFGFELPEDQIQPTCEETYAGAMSIITYAHDKSFPNTAATASATLWITLLALCVASATWL